MYKSTASSSCVIQYAMNHSSSVETPRAMMLERSFECSVYPTKEQ